MTVVDALLGLEPREAARNTPPFEACVAASNGMLIPSELVMQSRLVDSASHAQARLLRTEFAYKRRLLDRDRRIAFCLCEIVPRAPQASGGLLACLAAVAPPAVPRVLLLPASSAEAVARALPEDGAPLELLVWVDWDSEPARIERALQTLAQACAARRDARLIAVPRLGVAPPAATDALLRVVTEHAALLFLLPLLCATPGQTPRALYAALAAALASAGWTRLAPGLHAPTSTTPRPRLTADLTRLPQCDVLGLGPATWSRFDDVRFSNQASLRDYAHAIGRGGLAIAGASRCTPAEQFVEGLLCGLAGGARVDLARLAAQCHCDSPQLLVEATRVARALAAQGALSGEVDALCLEAANDCQFEEVCASVARLRDVSGTVTPLTPRVAHPD
ncbi:MAG: hypothetical protein K2Y51_10130 [Gammaproteobacteria bacterium]|nr:hypothetical protein [Gammaproteobacteria bacterium]